MESIRNFFLIIYTRFNADTPKFFRKVRSVCTWVTALSATATPEAQKLIIELTGMGLAVPPVVNQIATYIAVAGLVGRFFSSLPVDNEKLTKKEAEIIDVPQV